MGGIFKSKSPAPVTAAAKPATAAAKQISQAPEAVLETEGMSIKKKKKGKRPLITSATEVNVGGEGASGLNIPKG